jgi:hypothetical protein
MLLGLGSTCLPWGKGSDCWSGPRRSGDRLSAHDKHPRPAARRTARRRSTGRRASQARGGGRPSSRVRGHGPNRRRGPPGDRRARCGQDRAAGRGVEGGVSRRYADSPCGRHSVRGRDELFRPEPGPPPRSWARCQSFRPFTEEPRRECVRARWLRARGNERRGARRRHHPRTAGPPAAAAPT